MAIYTDDFNRAVLGADWTAIFGTWDIASNEIRKTGDGFDPTVVRFNSVLDTANHYAQIDFTSSNSSNGWVTIQVGAA